MLSHDKTVQKGMGKQQTQHQHKKSLYTMLVCWTLFYGSKIWTSWAQQEHQLYSYHLACLCQMSWRDRVSNAGSKTNNPHVGVWSCRRDAFVGCDTYITWTSNSLKKVSCMVNLYQAQHALVTHCCTSNMYIRQTWCLLTSILSMVRWS